MKFSFNQSELKKVIFLYDKKSLIDILKYVKIDIQGNLMMLTNLYHNHIIYNRIIINNINSISTSFMCYVEDIENIFSVLTKESEVHIDYNDYQLIIHNEGSMFHVTALSSNDFVEVDKITQLPPYSIKLDEYYQDIKNILITTNNNLSEYLAIKVNSDSIYLFNTDNYRIHSINIENMDNIPDATFILPNYLVDYIVKYNMEICFDNESEIMLKSKSTIIKVHKKDIITEFNKAFNYLSFIQQKTYFNTFTVNKSLFLEELKKHSIIDKNIIINIKPNGVVLFSQNGNINSNQIKTVSHAYAVEIKEHQSILIDLKYLIDFIKSHNQNFITIYTNIKYHLIFSNNNLCATKRM